MTVVKTRKKLIEVALPLDAINAASAREKSIRHGHPSTLHLYWARRPLAAARAVIFAQMVDDPSANPDLFPTEKAQDKERKRLFKIIEDLVKWENTTNEEVLNAARQEIWARWRRTCADNADHPQAKELFDRNKLPAFHDPFAGGGALPLEAQRLGLESYASDLNPVAVLINKAMIEIPPKFAGRPPVNPEWQAKSKDEKVLTPWIGAQGLAEDVRYYGTWLKEEAVKSLGSLYPEVNVTSEMTLDRPDLKAYEGEKLKVIAWIWARTVKSPNPAFSNVEVPLVSTFMLSNRGAKSAYVHPEIKDSSYRFRVRVGTPPDIEFAKNGTSAGKRAAFKCLMSGAPLSYSYIREQGRAGKIGTKLMAIVAEGRKGRVYFEPLGGHVLRANEASPTWHPDTPMHGKCRVNVANYGIENYGDVFTKRQLVALTRFSDLVVRAIQQAKKDAVAAGLNDSDSPLLQGGEGALAYAQAIGAYLAFAIDRMAMTGNNLVRWNPVGEKAQHCFGRQALPMLWDFAETNFLASATGSADAAIFYSHDPLGHLNPTAKGFSLQADAAAQVISSGKVVSTDPPYYDNIGYADLSDFFYVWLSRSLKSTFPELFVTMAVPKAEELVATTYRHGSKEAAEAFFMSGMTRAMAQLSEHSHSSFPVTIYYAFKQSEEDEESGVINTGWDTFLAAVINAGFSINGTWPLRTEMKNRQIAMGTNALASSIVLVCRERSRASQVATRKDFIAALKEELPRALALLQEGNVAPVDMAQAAIGPGMSIFTRYQKVVGADGLEISVREALTLINQVLDEQLAEQEGDWDADTRWATYWFDEFSFASGNFGRADDLARAKNTAVAGVVEAGIAQSSAGKVRLLKPEELPEDWSPETDQRATVWEMLHHLIRLQRQGEAQAAAMLARLGDKADAAKELAYRLYGICERKKRSSEGQLYNDLIMVWPDLVARSKEAPPPTSRPGEFNLDA